MQVEALGRLSPIEEELAFRRWCDLVGVRKVLLDYDNTISATPGVFRFWMEKCCRYLEDGTGMSWKTWLEELKIESDARFTTMSVNPERWNASMEGLQTRFGLAEALVRGGSEILAQIYLTPIPMLSGAEEGLRFLRRIGIPIHIVTHAGEGWTKKKFRWHGMDRYFSFDRDVYTVDVNGPKNCQSWQDAADYFRVDMRKVMVVGDSQKADIVASIEAGVPAGQTVLVDGLDWKLHQVNDLPNEVMRINNLGELAWIGHGVIFR